MRKYLEISGARMFERYTEEARKTIFHARYLAGEFGADAIEVTHLLLAGIKVSGTYLCDLSTKSITCEELYRKLEDQLVKGQRKPGSAEIPFSRETKEVIEKAMEEANAMSQPQIGIGHIFIGILSQEGSTVEQFLQENGITLTLVRTFVQKLG